MVSATARLSGRWWLEGPVARFRVDGCPVLQALKRPAGYVDVVQDCGDRLASRARTAMPQMSDCTLQVRVLVQDNLARGLVGVSGPFVSDPDDKFPDERADADLPFRRVAGAAHDAVVRM
jgi:hypothetical protein